MAQQLMCKSARFIRCGMINHEYTTNWGRIPDVRRLTLTSESRARSKEPSDKVQDEPIKFSTSKASHRTWKVERSMGSQYQRPWWKVLPLSVFGVTFLLWCAFRGETDIDALLEKELYEHLPGLLSDQHEDEEPSGKSS